MRDIEYLKKECERVFGHVIVSPADFNELCLRIKRTSGREISVSTLKRIWGYVEYPHTPTNDTLSTLSAYVGYKDWQDFRNTDEKTVSSDFIGKDIIKSSDFKVGGRLQLGWKPDRRCIIEHLGNCVFKVIEAENSKLSAGDEFSCGVIAKGEPLICRDIRRGGELIAEGYVAGKTDGIISLKILK